MKHLDLFSGIGGFSLAASWVWGKQHDILGFCEINKYCQKVLKKHWPDVPIFEDIKELNGKQFRGVDLITGGFPCQPFSVAGKRKGAEDDRHLWPEYSRILQEARPRWVIGENVNGIIKLELDNVLSDLEGEGYACQTLIIPACAVNAPHRRDRVWIIANRKGTERELSMSARAGWKGSADDNCPSSDTYSVETYPSESRGLFAEPCSPDSDVADTRNERLQGSKRPGPHDKRQASHEPVAERDNAWAESWPEVAQRFCQLYDGIPFRLDGYLTFTETHGIIGFILTIREAYYAKEIEDRNKTLQILHEALVAESVSTFFRRFHSIQEAKILRCHVHGKSYDEREKDEIRISEISDKAKEVILRKVREERESAYSSCGYGLEKQCSCKFDDIVRELSSEIALGEWKNNAKKAETYLFGLWKESRGKRFLSEPLQALHEIWKSLTHKEVGSFRRHYYHRDNNRVNRLKSLGNAIVPDVAFEILKAIKTLEEEK